MRRTIHLRDGRTIDTTGMTQAEELEHLRATLGPDYASLVWRVEHVGDDHMADTTTDAELDANHARMSTPMLTRTLRSYESLAGDAARGGPDLERSYQCRIASAQRVLEARGAPAGTGGRLFREPDEDPAA